MVRLGVKLSRQKLEQICLFLFLLVIPTQLGKHWWPEWSLINGIRIDYQALTLYLTDVVWIGLFTIFNLQFLIFNSKVKAAGRFLIKNKILILAIIGLVAVNVWQAENRFEAMYGWIRWGQFWWTVGYLIKRRDWVKKYLMMIIPWWLMVELGLGLAQVIKGGSLNGIFYWWGERRLQAGSLGVASWVGGGREWLRAYGSFSHPNSLAGFGLVMGWLWLSWQKKQTTKSWLFLIAMIFLILLTASRTVIILFLLAIGYQSFKKNKWRLVLLVLVFVFGGFLVLSGTVGGWDELGGLKRWQLMVNGWQVWQRSPLGGIGWHNFLIYLPRLNEASWLWLQPIHNIFEIILVETGIIGLIVNGWMVKKVNLKLNWCLVFIIISGLVDHYWLTLPQNGWLLAIVLAMSVKDRVQ